ncbi:MAG: VOC family protein [Solirubrobacteraceae bacterium]
MPISQFHHTGILVSDLDRSARFYIEALGAEWRNRPVVVEGEGAAAVFPGTPGLKFRFCYLGFPGGGALELMEFPEEPRPEWAVLPAKGMLPHFGLLVDDVTEAAKRVVAAGGQMLWPAPVDWGGAMVLYIADPDGNAMELFDQPVDRIIDMTNDLFPDARP